MITAAASTHTAPGVRAATKPALTVRLALPAELSTVQKHWVASYLRAICQVDKHEYLLPDKVTVNRGEWELAERLLARSHVRLLTREDSIVAFAVIDLDEPVIHYAWTSPAERKKGHFHALVKDIVTSPWTYTRETPQGRAIAKRLNGKFDPYSTYRLLTPQEVTQ